MADLAVQKIPVGISSCLMGYEVRYDKSHKRDNYIMGTLSDYFSFQPLCPEMSIGMSTPRPTIRLVQDEQGQLNLLGVKDKSVDVTTEMQHFSQQVVKGMGHLRGYILKRGSPSCGMERVRVYKEDGNPLRTDAGLFAQALMAQFPHLPIEEEGRLGDPMLRDNFIERVYVYDRWFRWLEKGQSAANLVEFHTQHKYLILAHHEVLYRELGRLVAKAGTEDIETLYAQYFELLMTALRNRATRKSHTNVLQHIMGYLKDAIDAQDRQELVETIDRYRLGYLPLIVPITLLKHHFRRHPNEYIEKQLYLTPHPDELKLRNVL